jgi:hypothetical protein
MVRSRAQHGVSNQRPPILRDALLRNAPQDEAEHRKRKMAGTSPAMTIVCTAAGYAAFFFA